MQPNHQLEQDDHLEDDDQLPEESAPKGCANCGHLIVEPGYPTPLCQTCRTALIKYPIPKGILIFIAVVALALIYAMTRVPANITAGVHLKRGKKAMKEGNYYTAQKEFEKVRKDVPGYTAVKEYLALAAFRNQDLNACLPMIEAIQGRQAENEEAVGELNEVITKLGDYFPSDSLNELFNRYPSIDSIPVDSFTAHVERHPEHLFASTKLASILYDKEQYEKTDSLLDLVLTKDNTYFYALFLKTTLKRELKQFDSAAYYSDRILALNKQSTFGISSRARILLHLKKDEEGLQWARKSYEINNDDAYTLATLALAYHFNNMPGERDKLIGRAANDSMIAYYMTYIKDVVSGKEQFREK